MNAQAATEAEVVEADAKVYGCTFGHYTQTGPWTDRRAMTWSTLATLLTIHQVGPKEGTCIVPAIFSGTRRQKGGAQQIDVAFLDSDAGATLQEITAALGEHGWTAAVSSTHSHLSTTTRAKRGNWDRYMTKTTDVAGSPSGFLVAEKGYLPRIAAGAEVLAEETEYVTFRHQPCPKFRVALPLLRSWAAPAYGDQRQANAAWKERIEALAAALRLNHDQACTDTSRLFYLPRRPVDGPPAETAVLTGIPCDIFALPQAAKPSARRGGGKATRPGKNGKQQRPKSSPDVVLDPFVDPDTGEVIDLLDWAAAGTASRFEIVKALKARRADLFVGKVTDGTKHHIRCANEDRHTDAGADVATMIVNSSQSTTKGFVYHCRHAHCDGVDRLVFLRRMLEQGWFKVSDLTDPRFLTSSRLPAEDAADVELTEHAVALAFANRHEGDLRYCHTAKSWYVWEGRCWVQNRTQLAFNHSRDFVAEMNGNAEFKTRAMTGKATFAGAVERFAQADPRLAVTSTIWDRDPFLLGTPNGTVDLRTGHLREAVRTELITRVTATGPVQAGCPNWLAFLHQAAGGDGDVVSFLQRWCGYCLTGDTREHALLFGYGPGGNGKSVFLNTVSRILGGYHKTAAMDVLTDMQGSQHKTFIAMLNGARLVTAAETEEGRAWAETKVKELTGGTEITANFMRCDPFSFVPQFKIIVTGNHKPILKNVDEAMRRRLNIVPFIHQPTHPDRQLEAKLEAEWPGILQWMIDGCLAWQRQGLQRPKAVVDATAEYFAAQDYFGRWLSECCIVDPSLSSKPGMLLAHFRQWCEQNGEPLSDNRRLRGMIERTPNLRYVNSRGSQFVRGVGLRPSGSTYHEGGGVEGGGGNSG